MKIAKLNIEGYIGGADIMSVFSGEEIFNISKLKKFLDSLDPDVTNIDVYINSGGGSVIEGWGIYDKLKASGKTITTIGEGMVGSIATVIFMAGSIRKLHENSTFFIHNPYCQPDGSPMGADDLISLGEDLKAEQKKILDFYVNQTGTDINTIEPLMSKATDLTTAQAISMGFATEVVNASVNARKYQLVAMVNIPKKENKPTQNNMEQTILSKWNKIFSKFSRVAKGKFFDMDVAATDDKGNAVSLSIESDTEDIIGKPAFIVDADGNQTPAPDGDYTANDGSKVITVLKGNVGGVETAEEESTEGPESLAKLQEKLDAALAENIALKASVEASKSETEIVKAKVKEMEPELLALKNTIIGEGAIFDTATQTFKNNRAEFKQKTHLDEAAERIKRSK